MRRRHDPRRRHRAIRPAAAMRRLAALLAGFLLVLAGLPLPASAVPQGSVAGGQGSSDTQDPSGSSGSPTASGSRILAAPQGVRPTGGGRQDQAEISAAKLTSVITSSSGWQARLTITNTSSRAIAAGTLTAYISPYSVQSAATAQNWANGRQVLRTPLVLSSVDIPHLASGASRTVRLSASKDSSALAAIRTWGAKPVLLDYSTSVDGSVAQLQTFATRSHDGLSDAKNPPITLTLALPLASDDWQVHSGSIHSLVSSSKATAHVASLSGGQLSRLKKLVRILQKNPQIQVVADPAVVSLLGQASSESSSAGSSSSSSSSSTSPQSATEGVSLPLSRLQGVMQPYVFDIPASLAFTEKQWKAAGITAADWSAAAGRQLLAGTGAGSTVASGPAGSSASSSPSSSQSSSQSSGQSSQSSSQSSSSQSSSQSSAATTHAIAWEGAEAWDTTSLATALGQGYSTVVSESAVPSSPGANQTTGRIRVSTGKGDITVLIAQHELSSLASGSPTSSEARGQAEGSDAGRLARLVAQSSIYEAEQPYISRNLLVSLGRDADPSLVQKILDMLPSCDWVHTGTLADLEQGKSGTSLDASGPQQVDSSVFSLTGDRSGGSTLDSTASAARAAVDPRVRRSSLKKALSDLASSRSTIDRVGSSILDQSSVKKKTNDTGDTDNPQNLANQDAQQAAENRATATQWLDKLRQAHRQLALLAMSVKSPGSSTEALAAKDLATDLLGAVTLTPPDHVNIFSQSARMPVTVKNGLPFPIRVSVGATTNLIATTITPSQSVHVLANSEAQTNFTIKAIGASQAQATFRLVDASGRAFGTDKSVTIYSQLSLGDMSGYILIALAVVLGIFGLWRQFHVKKDPDQ